MKRISFSIALALALVMLFGAGSALMACGNACTTAKSSDCGPCPMTKSASTATKVEAQAAKSAACPFDCCQGDPSKCPSPDCLGKGKDCGGKCDGICPKGCCKTTSSSDKTKSGATVKTVKAVEVKSQTAGSA